MLRNKYVILLFSTEKSSLGMSCIVEAGILLLGKVHQVKLFEGAFLKFLQILIGVWFMWIVNPSSGNFTLSFKLIHLTKHQ